jgi:hypothetical protein
MGDNVHVINQPFTTRTSASGRQRTTIEVSSEPLVVNLDPKQLGRGVAMAIADTLRSAIKGITQVATESTQRARENAAKQFAGIQEQRATAAAAKAARAASKPTAAKQPTGPKYGPKKPPKYGPTKPQSRSADQGVMKRYSGGKLGAMPPNQTDRLFNDSGRLVRSIVAQAAEGAQWIVNVAGNRFSVDTLDTGGDGSPQQALSRIMAQLARYVPMIANPALLMSAAPVRAAVEATMQQMIHKSEARISELKMQRAKAIASLFGI